MATLCDPPPAAHPTKCPPQGRPALPLPANRPSLRHPNTLDQWATMTENSPHQRENMIHPRPYHHCRPATPTARSRRRWQTGSRGGRHELDRPPTGVSMTSSSISGGDSGSGEHTDDLASPSIITSSGECHTSLVRLLLMGGSPRKQSTGTLPGGAPDAGWRSSGE